MSDKTVLPTPEIIGSLLDLPEHVQSVIKAYGDARARVALHNERAVLASAGEQAKDAERWRIWIDAVEGSSGVEEAQVLTAAIDECRAKANIGKEAIATALENAIASGKFGEVPG